MALYTKVLNCLKNELLTLSSLGFFVFLATSAEATAELQLSSEQTEWLEENPHIRVGMPLGIPGLSSYQNGKYQGLFHDYLEVVAQKTGIEFEIVHLYWPDIITAAQNREIDVFMGISTQDRAVYMDFTTPFYSIPYVIAVNVATPDVQDPTWLKGKKVAVIGKVAVEDYVKAIEDVKVTSMQSTVDALWQVAFKKVDAYIGNLLTIETIIAQERISSVRVATGAGFPDDPLCFAIRNDWPILHAILDQAVVDIEDTTHSQIIKKWLFSLSPESVSWDKLAYWLGIMGGIILITIVVITIWSRQLQRTVRERTLELALEKERVAINEERYRLLQDATSDGIWDWNIPNNVVYWSPRSYQMLGYDVNEFELNFETWERLVHPDDLDSAVAAIRSALESNEPYSAEFRYKTKFGEWVWVQANGFIVNRDQDGKPVRMVGSHTDLSEKKNTQAKLREQYIKLTEMNKELVTSNDQAQAALKAKDEFLAVISHELRTPLNPILGFSELLLEETPKDSASAESISLIRNSAHKMLDLIDDILDFTRIQKHTLDPEPEEFLIKDLIKLSVSEAESSGNKKAKIIQQNGHPPDLKAYLETEEVIADPKMIGQVLSNLLTNAAKYSSDTPIHLRVGYPENRPNNLRFEVEDSGIGISPELQENIFEAFYQVDSSFTRKYEGLGLGLAICKKIVDLNKGTIGLDSDVGKGSTFWFEIPVKRPNRKQKVPVPIKKHKHTAFSSDLKILVAEDQLSNQIVIEAIIKRLGATPTIVKDGKAAIDAVDASDYDLILMDLSMPIMSGFEATNWIRNYSQNKEIPIIALTAHEDEACRNNAEEVKMNGYITKPIKVSEFASTIESFLSQDTSSGA